MKRLTALALLTALLLVPLNASAQIIDDRGRFHDDDGSVHEADIEQIARMGITQGCWLWLYCPDDDVTRGQMAAFLNRLLDLPATNNDYYSDDSESIFEADINEARTAGIVFGTDDGMYSPDAPLARWEMAVFMYNTDLCSAVIHAEPVFSDVTSNGLVRQAVESCAEVGVIRGHEGQFFPDEPVSRAQMASFLVRLAGKL